MNAQKLFLLLFVVATLIACEDTKTSDGTGSKVNSFSITPTTVNYGESFTVSMDLTIGFDAYLRIRPANSTEKGDSLYYKTYLTGYDKNITFTYNNGNLTSNVTSDYSATPGSYEIYAQVCDLDPIAGSTCVDSAKIVVTLTNNNSQPVKSFSVSSNLIKTGESFSVGMELGEWDTATLRIRQQGYSISIPLLSMSNTSGYDNNITLTYANGKLTSPKTQEYILTPGDYQLYLNVCDINRNCIDSPIYVLTFDDGTLSDINLEWILVGSKIFTFDYGITKTVTIHNNTTVAQNYQFTPATNLFRSSFEKPLGDTFSLPAGEYDNLTVDVLRDDAEALGLGRHERELTLSVDGVGKTYIAKVGVLITANEECIGGEDSNGNCIDGSQSRFNLTTDKPLAGFALGESLEYLKGFNAILKFDSDFFAKFKLDERSTCRINLDNTISLEKQCLVILLKKDGGTSNLTLTAKDPNDGTEITKKIIFNAN